MGNLVTLHCPPWSMLAQEHSQNPLGHPVANSIIRCRCNIDKDQHKKATEILVLRIIPELIFLFISRCHWWIHVFWILITKGNVLKVSVSVARWSMFVKSETVVICIFNINTAPCTDYCYRVSVYRRTTDRLADGLRFSLTDSRSFCLHELRRATHTILHSRVIYKLFLWPHLTEGQTQLCILAFFSGNIIRSKASRTIQVLRTNLIETDVLWQHERQLYDKEMFVYCEFMNLS